MDLKKTEINYSVVTTVHLQQRVVFPVMWYRFAFKWLAMPYRLCLFELWSVKHNDGGVAQYNLSLCVLPWSVWISAGCSGLP